MKPGSRPTWPRCVAGGPAAGGSAARRTLTFVGALRYDRLVAPCGFNGPIKGTSLRAWVEQLLVPALRPGDIVVMGQPGFAYIGGNSADDPSRRSAALVPAALLTGPNPFEQAFAKIKHWMRLAQKRTIEETWRHLGHLVSSIQPAQCTNYFQNAGYPSEKS